MRISVSSEQVSRSVAQEFLDALSQLLARHVLASANTMQLRLPIASTGSNASCYINMAIEVSNKPLGRLLEAGRD